MHSLTALLIATTELCAAVPVTFAPSSPAKAQEVNSNFTYLDTSMAKKANRTSLDSLGRQLKSKADTGALTPIKTDLASMKSQLSGVRGDSWILDRISDTANNLRGLIGSGATSYPASYLIQGPNDIINGAPWYGIGLSNIPSDANYLVQLGGYYGLNILSGGGYPIQFYSSNDHKIAVFEHDNVSFYTSPGGVPVQIVNINGSGLSVTGDIVATGSVRAKTLTQVPDYVFESDYKLAPLSEVEAYTKEHKHLPDVPAAAEIEANGVDLAQMNMILLRKIEELTLHTIQQQKRLDSQDLIISELKTSVETLKSR